VLVFIENLNHYDYLHYMYRNLFKSLLIVPFIVIQFVNCLLAETNSIRSLEEIVYEAKCNQDRKFEIADLVRRNLIYYEKFSDEPLCGTIKNHGRVYKGMREGKWTNYFPNGQLHAKTFFVKNKNMVRTKSSTNLVSGPQLGGGSILTKSERYSLVRIPTC